MTHRSKSALFIVITDYPGGAERVTLSLAAELASRPEWTVEVFVVCAKLPESFVSTRLPPNVAVRYGRWENWYVSFPFFAARLAFSKYDFVFSTHIYVNAMVSTLRRLGLMKIGRFVMRESMSLFDRFSGFKTRVFNALYHRYGAEDLIVAQTGYMAEHVRPWLPERSRRHLTTLPNPVDFAAIRSAMAEPLESELKLRLSGKTNILFCGRFVEFKRPGLALEVFRLLRERGIPGQLVFMGSGPLEREVAERAAQLGLGDSVLFLGQRANPYPVMAACQFGLLTSANEGFPNVVLEMMACGARKVVVTPCAGDLDSLAGVTVTGTHEAHELASALQRAMQSGEDRSQEYEAAAAERSVRPYVDRVLGPA